MLGREQNELSTGWRRTNLWCMIFIDRERQGVIEQTKARSWAAKVSQNRNSVAMHAAIERRRAGAE
jgi:hypothetical protein